ncbi:DNA polymerase family A-domain-containing protein [Lipomyces kononenkoae]|uniref:DNA polymerase family A-domain-containing protein n=1 Tax=Lipomyces kononenkoae TaxID=34357 RepID=A0ACC3T7Q5_LIPKO
MIKTGTSRRLSQNLWKQCTCRSVSTDRSGSGSHRGGHEHTRYVLTNKVDGQDFAQSPGILQDNFLPEWSWHNHVEPPVDDFMIDKLAEKMGHEVARKTAVRPPKRKRKRNPKANVEIDIKSLSKTELEEKKIPNADPTGEQRFNEVGIQQLAHSLHRQLFLNGPTAPYPDLVKLSRHHLEMHKLLGKQTDTQPPITTELTPLLGQSLDEHFYRLGMHVADPYLNLSKEFAKMEKIPPMPEVWLVKSGWTKYEPGKKPVKVPHPDAQCLVFDTEVMYKESPFAVMATAMSKDAWYCWISPWLLEESENDRQLIPLGTQSTAKVIVGHNVGYDRARVKDEYSFRASKAMFLDTMSLHVATNGMCSQQRPTWIKHQKKLAIVDKLIDTSTGTTETQNEVGQPNEDEKDEPWIRRSAINGLADVAKFHCDIDIAKDERVYFGTLDRQGIRDMIQGLINYCARDVETTYKVYQKVLPAFLDVCPHPVSFAALRDLSSVFLPIDDTWKDYVANAEARYQELLAEVETRLKSLVEQAVTQKDDLQKNHDRDPWLRQLDWTIKEIRMVKPKKKGEEPRLAKNQKLPGYPLWYKMLFPTANSEMNVSVRTRIAPIMFRMSWDGHPLVWTDAHGWTFRVDKDKAEEYLAKNFCKCDIQAEDKAYLQDDRDGVYFKVPHKDGPSARCASPLAKGYLQHFESGVLSSEYPYAREALEMNAACSYWISARERISSQVTVWKEDTNLGINPPSAEKKGLGMILPAIIPMGTITRRAVEATWLTASNAKRNRVGSELKAMVRAPEGYKFVGADVDSEELWIASLVGDSQFGIHGGTAIGWMTLEGTKSLRTDLHSNTATILNISRNDAKVFNYGRIYGAGLKFAVQLLRQFNPTMSEDEACKTATKLYESTKGMRARRGPKTFRRGPFWFGGTESLMFNKLEEIANQEIPRTPVLGCAITEALMRTNLESSMFMTSRINWAIQSSGVDYLHLLIVSMNYLIELFKLDARLCITVHDEIRYLVKEKDRYKVAMALQISNLWTRAMFCEQLGIHDIPQSCAFFSAVDIDHVIRKEVDLPCVTPSHPDPIAAGESLDIATLLSMPSAKLKTKKVIDLSRWEYTPRTPVFDQMEQHQQLLVKQLKDKAPIPSSDLSYLSAQISKDGKPTYR